MEISIIIPTLNRKNSLRKTLESIALQEKNGDFEVIVVDNGSTDGTKDLVLTFNNEISNLKYLYNNIPGLLTGRHEGAMQAKGEILCFIDDDVILSKEYIFSVKFFFKESTYEIATGPSLPEYETAPPEWLKYFWESPTPNIHICSWLSLLDFGKQQEEIDPNMVWGLNFCIKKSTLIKLGGFNPDCIPTKLQKFQGDGESGLTMKAIKAGIKAGYSPNITLKHLVSSERLTFEYFKKRAYYQGVCNSFSDLRSIYLYKTLNKPTALKKLRNILHPYYKWIKCIYLKPKKPNYPRKIKELLKSLKKSEIQGYQFHQNAFYTDEIVKEWVLKENYWDYNLPKLD